MTTTRDFILMAMKECGVLGIGQSMLSEDINDGLTTLNRMLAQWQKKRWLVPSLQDISATGNSQKSNLIGPGQHYNAARPDKIQAAYFVQKSNNVSFPLTPIWSYEDYSLIALKELNTWPLYFFYDGAFPYGNVHVWPIPTSDFEIHLIVKSHIGFTIQVEAGEIVNSGIGYVDGSYIDVPFTNLSGFGSGATSDVTVAGGVVADVTVHELGDGYKINDSLTINSVDLGGTGSGFSWKVTQVTDTLDAEFNMPPEYEEAIHYNLAVRLCAMYQYPQNPNTVLLAKSALNTLRTANAQIPSLKMPNPLLNNRGSNFNIYAPDVR